MSTPEERKAREKRLEDLGYEKRVRIESETDYENAVARLTELGAATEHQDECSLLRFLMEVYRVESKAPDIKVNMPSLTQVERDMKKPDPIDRFCIGLDKENA